MVAAFAFKIQDGVDHMFQNARAGNGSLFGYMTDQKKNETLFLGQLNQFISAGAHLGNTARRGFHFFQIHGLYRIDNNHRSVRFVQRFDNIFNVSG